MAQLKTARRVVRIDPAVRQVIDLYVRLFPNYAKAANHLHVSKDTLAKYVSGNANMAIEVFRRMADVVRRRYPKDELVRHLQGHTLRELLSGARTSNLRQTDHVMVRIDASLLELLHVHCNGYASRSRAAHALDINPRTFKAYLNGQISSFPRKKLLALLDSLENRADIDKESLDEMRGDNWDQALSIRERAATIDLDQGQMLERFLEYFDKGDLRVGSIDRSLLNLSKRMHGNLGATLRATMEALADRQERRISKHVHNSDLLAARREIRRWESCVRLYTKKLQAINRALPRGRKQAWREEIVAIVQRKEIAKDKLRELESGVTPVWEDSETTKNVIFVHGKQVKLYEPSLPYAEGERIYHPIFGAGRVCSLEKRGRMTVLFNEEYGEVTLAANIHS